MNSIKYCPKVSIVIPAYNASNYLKEAIDCALSQTYSNLEVIVVNDGSCDENATKNIALSYQDRIIYIEKENGGASSALNKGIQSMSGEWFSWLSHDDLYYPKKIEKQIEYLNSIYSSIDNVVNNILFTASELIDKDKKLLKRYTYSENKKISDFLLTAPNNSILICEPTKYTFHGCSCLIHRTVFERVGYFNENLRIINDVDMWFRIYAGGYKIHYLPEVLVQGRVHSKQISRSIGFSYHNSEQDMYWQRSLDWLKKNCSNDYKLFVKYGCNAYLKTRYKNGDDSFEWAKALNDNCNIELFVKKICCVSIAKIRDIAKKVYLKIGTGN